MARVALSLAIAILVAFSVSVAATRSGPDKGPWGLFDMLGYSLVCIPKTSSVVEAHEGRHTCAYDAKSFKGKYRAVGVAYDLDEHPIADRKSEIGYIYADYDKVYDGKQCLNNFQINALVAISVRRALDEAGECVKAIDNFNCDVQAVLGDLIFALGKDYFCKNYKDFIEKLSAEKFEDAAKTLKDSEWCGKNKDRCDDNLSRILHEEGGITFGKIASVVG